jgi:hypothetical protein
MGRFLQHIMMAQNCNALLQVVLGNLKESNQHDLIKLSSIGGIQKIIVSSNESNNGNSADILRSIAQPYDNAHNMSLLNPIMLQEQGAFELNSTRLSIINHLHSKSLCYKLWTYHP